MLMPEPSKEDVDWAVNLWGSLKIEGTWTLPAVGVYRRTGANTMSLTHIHASRPNPDVFGQSLFDKHDWIVALGEVLGWTIIEEVEEAWDEDDERILVPLNSIGDAGVCSNKCGAIFTVQPIKAGVPYYKIDQDGTCPICMKKDSVPNYLRDMHVVVDDSAYLLKMKYSEEE